MALSTRNLSAARIQIGEFLERLQDLLATLNEEGVETTSALRERIAIGIDSVHEQIEAARDSLDEGAEVLGGLIRDNPWVAVATGAVIGTALGCVATEAVAQLSSSGGFAGAQRTLSRQASRLGDRYRPYARRARKAAASYWPF